MGNFNEHLMTKEEGQGTTEGKERVMRKKTCGSCHKNMREHAQQTLEKQNNKNFRTQIMKKSAKKKIALFPKNKKGKLRRVRPFGISFSFIAL